MPHTSGPRQDYALKTLRRTVELHAARRAAATSVGANVKGVQLPPALMPMSKMPPDQTLPASQPFNLSQMPPETTLPASQAFILSQGSVPETAIPASQLWNVPPVKAPCAVGGAEAWESQSTQVPSNIGPTPPSTQSNSQLCASQPQWPGSQCMSQPLLQPLAASQNGAVAAQPPVISQNDAAVSQPVEPPATTLSGSSSGVQAAAAVLAAAFAGIAHSNTGAAATLTGSAAVVDRGYEACGPVDGGGGVNGTQFTEFAAPPRRRLRGKQPWPPLPASPFSSASASRHRRCRRAHATRRRHVRLAKCHASDSSDNGEQTPSSEAHRSRMKGSKRRREQATPSPAHSGRSSNASELTALSRAASSAATAALAGPLRRGLRWVNEERAGKLRRIRKESDALLALLSEYRRACSENDTVLAEVVTLIEEAMVMAQGCAGSQSAGRSGLKSIAMPAPSPLAKRASSEAHVADERDGAARGRDFLAALRHSKEGIVGGHGRRERPRLIDGLEEGARQRRHVG